MATGAALAMEVAGTGPALLLIHGAGGSVRSNFPFVDELAQRYTVLAPDLPGVGGSELGAEPLTAVGVAHRLLAAVDRAGIEHFAVCGYSMGTLIAMALQELAPERVTTVILTAGLARANGSARQLMDRWSALLQRDRRAAANLVLDRAYREDFVRANGAAWREATSARIAAAFPEGTDAHIALVRSADTRATLAMTEHPVLVIVPTRDAFISPSHSDEIRLLRGDAETLRIDCGHAIGEEAPDLWLTAITRFLDTHLALEGA